ncbi:response regulator [Luteitalea sp.]|uniref:response regulator n=1 Tax=Luteitalea sp. TaxID=2004800 RepID=UPI0025C2979F|nr:response regulator [Luteitalea sp.]
MNPARALQTVADLGARALSSTPVGDLLDAGMRLAREVTQSDHAVFFERSPGGDALLMRAGIGWRPGIVGRVSLSTGQGSFGRYILQQPTRIVDALPSHPEFGLPAVLREHNVESMACVRLDGIGHPLGVVAVFNVNDGLPSTEHLTFLEALGNILATAILRQVTEEGLLQSQIRLQSVQKMEAIGRLAGGIAHDFNNLVQAIGGYTEILLRQLREDDPLRRNAEEIKKAGDRAAALTRQLLAFSRQQVLQPSLLDVNHIVHHVEQLLARLIGEDVELRTYLSDDLWPVKADAAQLEQVLMNLAVNARDAMKDGGLLTIETANVELTRSVDGEPFVVVAGPYVLLAVTDTGTGMNAETKARAFEPFFTTKPPGQGTGLGLSMVYGIVKQSGGYIWVDSELGAGTRIRIYLPRADEMLLPLELPAEVEVTPSAAAALAEAAERHAPSSCSLLLVEDEDGVRELIHEWLSAHDYVVHAAEDGQHALQVAEGIEQLDLLIADVVMPTMGGPALAKRLLQARPDLKVIFVSGYADEAIGDRRMLEDGASFLQKPFTLEELLKKVRAVLDDRRPSRAPGGPH